MSFDVQRLQKQLCEMLCGEVRLRQTPQGFLQVVTPFTFSDGDVFQLYLQETPGGGVRLTDYGHTFMHLSYENDLSKLREGTRGKLLDQVLAESGVEEDGGQLFLDTDIRGVGARILRFGQAITRIYDLTYLNRSRVASTFYEDLKELLFKMVEPDKIEPDYVIAGESNAEDYIIDYRIPGKRAQLFVMGIATRDKARLTTIILEHWLRCGVDFDSLLIFSDQQEIPRVDLARLSNAGGEMVASLDATDDLRRKLVKLAAA
jgi:hypothetical protein